MNDPKRYSIFNPQEQENPNGAWVHYSDYARLKAECQARQAENSVLAVECDSLKAEVERLTKAGDLMCRMAGNNQVINRHWKTAKKGVQS